jgi:hypothetical protein
VNHARRDLCGGHPVMDVPTAIGTVFQYLGVRGITPVMFSRDQLKRAATLTEDFVQLGKCRRPHNRLGFAYQVALFASARRSWGLMKG